MKIDEIQKVIETNNIPVFGIGSASEMKDEPAGYRPEDFLPGAQSLICFGIPLASGIYNSTNYQTETIWRSQNLMYRQLDSISLNLSSLLEQSGAQAIPIFGCMPLGVNDRGAVVGILNQLRMAEICRIGVIGKNGLLINKRFGARLMLGGLLTTASLPKINYPEFGESGCPSECRVCIDSCPVNALMPEKKKVKIMRCLTYTAKTANMSRLKFFYLLKRNKPAAARYMSMTSFDEHTFHICSKCISTCPYGLAE